MKPKVQILTTCPYCEGEAYLPDRAETSEDGQQRIIYEPCPDCLGSGRQKIWIDLSDLLEMLADHYQRDPMEPDWLALTQTRPVSAYLDSLEAAGI